MAKRRTSCSESGEKCFEQPGYLLRSFQGNFMAGINQCQACSRDGGDEVFSQKLRAEHRIVEAADH